MHERRNVILSVLFALACLWALFAFLIVPDHVPGIWPSPLFHKLASLGTGLVLGAFLVYAYKVEDRLDDPLGTITMGRYYERDGLCLAPLTRVTSDATGQARAEISLYYQSRYSGVCEAVIHLRPEGGAFHSHRGAHDVHFAFRCQPGGHGVVHQPIAVAREHQGEPVRVLMAAAVRWNRGKGEQVRSRRGLPCGTFDVDWALAYRQSRHELSGEIELIEPVAVRLTMPENVQSTIDRAEYVQETFSALTV